MGMALTKAEQELRQAEEAFKAQPDKAQPDEVPSGVEAPVVETPAVETPAAETPTEPSELDRVKAELSALQHKHSVLVGKYNAEIEAIKLARAEEEKAAKEKAAVVPDDSSLSDQDFAKKYNLTDEDMEQGRSFWQRQIQISEQAAARIAEKTVKAAEEQIKPIQERMAETEQEKFMSGVLSSVPDFYAVNDSPVFHKWLSDNPGMQDVLDIASTTLSTAKAVSVFNLFKIAQNAQNTPQPTAKVVPLPTVESQVMAPKAAPPASPSINDDFAEMKDIEQQLDRDTRKRTLSPDEKAKLMKRYEALSRKTLGAARR